MGNVNIFFGGNSTTILIATHPEGYPCILLKDNPNPEQKEQYREVVNEDDLKAVLIFEKPEDAMILRDCLNTLLEEFAVGITPEIANIPTFQHHNYQGTN